MAGRIRALRSVLLGDPGEATGAAIHDVTRFLSVAAAMLANIGGTAVVVVLLLFVLPTAGQIEGNEIVQRNLVVAAAYLVVVLPGAVMYGRSVAGRRLVWLIEDRPPTERERRLVLRMNLHLLALQTSLWTTSALVFFALNAGSSLERAVDIATTVALGGLTTAAIAYLLWERLSRAVVARALADAPPRRYRLPGVAIRALAVWAFGTMVPVVGVMLVAVAARGDGVSADELARSALVLSLAAVVVGFYTTLVFARSLSGPLRRLRRALNAVEQGDFGVSVPVTDASEVGFVQSGFNRMVVGLRERERLRDLFGRHVGHDVASRAVEEGTTLGGEEREAAVLFIDLSGSTALAEQRTPTEVVTLLNEFFAVVVDVAHAHGGFVNKFEGDAALCVFGAPLHHDDPAGAALAAAREMQGRLSGGAVDMDAGIGVSFGRVVAGNVGATDRFEYTVIGDPVNEASRLTDLAKERRNGILASEVALLHADDGERRHWEVGGTVTLRGRSAETTLALPRRDQPE